MKPWVELGRAAVAGGGQLVLAQRDREYSLRVGGTELMSSRVHVSEDALGRLGGERVATVARPAILVGGLGMGFTLRAALDAAPAHAAITVAELVPEVIAWNRGPLAALAARPLDDRRVRVITGDVGAVIAQAPARWDAILMDVDNGPDALVDPHNDALYGERGIARARRALRPGGCFAVWSAFDAPALTRRLRAAGFAVRVEQVRASGARHRIWVAQIP